MSLRQHWRLYAHDESGFAGGADGLVFGLLIFVVGTLLAGNAWAVVDTKLAADAAARQAVRTYVEAPNAAEASMGAQQSADDALADYGRSPSKASLSVGSAEFGRCQRVTIKVHYRAPLVELPIVGKVGLAESVTAQVFGTGRPVPHPGCPGTATCG